MTDDDRGISCPSCGCRHLRVSYSSDMHGGRYIVKRCRNCHQRVRTKETVERLLPPTKADLRLFDISKEIRGTQ